MFSQRFIRDAAAAFFACSGVGACSAQELALNLAVNYEPVRQRMLAGDGDILCIGDSLTFRGDAFYENFRPMVQSRYGDGGIGWRSASVWTGFVHDGSWNAGVVDADVFPYRSMDGMWAQRVGSNASEGFFASASRESRIFYLMQPGGGSFRLRGVDSSGSDLGFISTASSVTSVQQFAVSFGALPPAQWRTRVIPESPGTITLLGQIGSSGTPGVRVHRAANGGFGVRNFQQRDPTFDAIVRAIDPDLCLIMLGQNDGAISPGLFRQNMNIIISRLLVQAPTCKVVLISSYDSGAFWLPDFTEQCRSIARERGVGFIDLFHAGGSYAVFANAGLLFEDGIHFSAVGGRYVADLIFTALETGGSSLSLCGELDFNNDGVSPDVADIEAFLAVFSGSPCPTNACDPLDFNHDGVSPDSADIDTLLAVFAGATCPL